MKNPVVIKNYPKGLSVILDPDIPFDELYLALGKKFRESSKFFGKTKLVISFEGRELMEEEERLLVDAIADNSELTVLCTVGKGESEKSQQYIKAGTRFIGDQDKMLSKFYKGPIRASEVVEADTDLIILGDVNPGAEVISEGNIIILGTLYGTARAGVKGNESSFVVALDLRPVKICIGEKSMNIFAKRGLFKSKANPKIVFVKDEELLVEEITSETIDKLQI
ncbi:MAG: septum site-determining protein MinC [Lachnospiraceae bacterium]|nr:septum site-determining protein MinC [Lachnospiraceae bacterium]